MGTDSGYFLAKALSRKTIKASFGLKPNKTKTFKAIKHTPKQYTLCNHKNTKSLIFGYAYTYQSALNILIPIDVIQTIHKFYDNLSTVWTIANDGMTQFRKCAHRDSLSGPTLEPVSDLKFELSLCPKGWRAEHKCYIAAYLCCVSVPRNLKNVCVQYTLKCKELQNITHTRTLSLKALKCKGYGWDPKCVCYARINAQNITHLRIECGIAIHCIEYAQSHIKNYIPLVPKIKNVFFRMEFDQTMMAKIVSSTQYRRFWSEPFGNQCFILTCLPYEFERANEGQFRVYLMLLRLPSKTEQIKPFVEVTAYADRKYSDKVQ